MAYNKSVKISSSWRFKNSKNKLIVTVFEVNKMGKYTEIVYGLKSGHITCILESFLENYEKEAN